jgi:ABC-2 type transport system permease protein
MSALLAIAWREYAAFFRTSMGWVIVALYLILAGVWIGFGAIRPGEPATLRVFFGSSQWLLLAVAPAISMRLLAEEFRAGTFELVQTSPASDWAVAAAKFLAGWAVVLTMLAPSLTGVLALELVADPDYGPIAAGYAGLALLGAVYISAGLLMSSLTQNQVVAFIATIALFLGWWFATTTGAAAAPEPWNRALHTLALAPRMTDFASGVIDSRHAAFFALVTAWFVSMSALSLETRRWR